MPRFVAALTLCAVLSQGPDASAQGTDKNAATAYFELGRKLFDAGRYPEAIRAFRQAYGLWRHRSILFNLALTYAFMGQKIKAAVHLKEYLKVAKEKEQKLPPILVKVQQQTGTLVVRLPDPNAAIYVDGRMAGKGTLDIIVESGARSVEVRIGDRFVARKTVNVPGGGRAEWKLAEPPRPAPAITRRPGAAAGGSKPTVRVRVRGRLHWAYFVSAAAVTAAAIGASVWLSFKTRSVYRDFVDGGRIDRDLQDRGKTYLSARNAMWGVSAVVGAGAVALAVFTRWKRESATTSVSVLPSIGPRGAGLAVRFQR